MTPESIGAAIVFLVLFAVVALIGWHLMRREREIELYGTLNRDGKRSFEKHAQEMEARRAAAK